jgi:hypothetical protein
VTRSSEVGAGVAGGSAGGVTGACVSGSFVFAAIFFHPLTILIGLVVMSSPISFINIYSILRKVNYLRLRFLDFLLAFEKVPLLA